MLRRLFTEHWSAWAGSPTEIVLDPAKTNLGDPMVVPAELEGTEIRTIAAGAHWQLGKCETHGGWFNRLLEKLIDEFSPSTKEEWLECVTHAHVKNQHIQVHGYSPYQFVFGRNTHIPTDLLSEPLMIVPATASLSDEAIARTQAMRTSARAALVQMQDDKAMRVALLARPRTAHQFTAGDLVAYWRNQKWIQGQLQQGGQWYGVAIVLGHVGRNLVLLHRRQVIRCAPEQVRPATNEEKCLLASPQVELLGIKDMLEQGNLRSKQYIDLLPQSYPPQEGPTEPPGSAESPEQVGKPEESHPPAVLVEQAESSSRGSGSESVPPVPSPPEVETRPESAESADSTDSRPAVPAESTYGPVRRRVGHKDGPMALWRPPALRQEDFVEIMKEVVPQLVEDACMNQNKRPASPHAEESAAHRPEASEALSVQDVSDLESAFNESWGMSHE